MIAWVLWPLDYYTIFTSEETPINVSLRALDVNACAGLCYMKLANAENYVSPNSLIFMVLS